MACKLTAKVTVTVANAVLHGATIDEDIVKHIRFDGYDNEVLPNASPYCLKACNKGHTQFEQQKERERIIIANGGTMKTSSTAGEPADAEDVDVSL